MYGVIAEDQSDVDTLRVLIRRLSNNSWLPVKGPGYGGCGEMLRKGKRQLRLYADQGCKRLVVCYDSDGQNAEDRRQEAIRKIITPAGLARGSCLALVPVQELEAWILADLHQAIPRVISSWKPTAIPSPESIASPKEHLEGLSRGSNKKPRYAHATHNEQVAKYLDLQVVSKKCPAFRPLVRFVTDHRKIKLPDQPFPGSGKRGVWAFTDPDGSSRYAGQLATAHEWGEVIDYVQTLDPRPEELASLCGHGWADLRALAAEVHAVLTKSKPKGQARKALTALHAIAAGHNGARYLGLDDGTR